jgi:hypothetical protein
VATAVRAAIVAIAIVVAAVIAADATTAARAGIAAGAMIADRVETVATAPRVASVKAATTRVPRPSSRPPS